MTALCSTLFGRMGATGDKFVRPSVRKRSYEELSFGLFFPFFCFEEMGGI